MTAVATRRALFALGGASVLSACGFQPVYMPTASGQAGPARRELAAIYVNLLPDRPGMLLRQALQDRFEGDGSAAARLYELAVTFWISGEGLGIQADTTVTRIRMIGHANWTLIAEDPGRTHLTQGSARTVDALNLLDTQVFAGDLEIETIQRRTAEAVADQISLQLAAYFRKRAATPVTG